MIAQRSALLSLVAGCALLVAGCALLVTGCAQVLGDVELPEPESGAGALEPSAVPSPPDPEQISSPLPEAPPPVLVSESPSSEEATPSDIQLDLTEDALCAPDARRCLAGVRQSCAADGSGWLALEVCASASLCTPDRCLQATCGAHELRCDGRELQQCNDARDGWLLIAGCETPAHCSLAGPSDSTSTQCSAEPCQPDARRCNGARLERCLADRSGWELIVACESGDLCAATLTEGSERCAPPVCDARELRCLGTHLERCNPGRSGWSELERCRSEQLCATSAAAGSPRCEPASCAPFEHVCAGNQLRACDVGLTGFREKATCLATELCDPVRGRCGARECSAGERRCNGARIESCSAEQTGFVATDEPPCATSQLCRVAPGEGASCTPPVCAVGQFRCAGPLLQRCSDGRDAWLDFATCASAQLCNAERGAAGCVPQDCEPGERRCLGDTLTLCRAGGDGSDVIANCASAGGCDAATLDCRDPCVVGSARCQAEQLEICTDPLLGWQSTACVSAELCDATNRRCEPPACAVGARRCAGANVEECNAARTGFAAVEQCASAALCAQTGDQAACRAPACAAGETLCDGDDLVACNAARTGFVLSEACTGRNACVDGPPARCRR
ncbi:MAG: hypothetical protein RL033_1063 [Pseudomonadota bacterium]